MSSSASQSTPDDVPALRLPMQELTQTVQAAAMLVSALRSRRQELGVRAWHPHEDAAREHDVAESPPVTQPSAQDHAHRWAHAAAGAWGSGNVAAQPDTWLQPDPRERGELQALWTVAGELEQRGYSPAEVLAGLSAPETERELSGQLHEAVDSWPSWRDSSGEDSRVWHEPGAGGRVIVTRWEAGGERSKPSLTRISARDAEIADQALGTLRDGNAQQRQSLVQAAQVGARSRDRTRGPREQVVSADQVHAGIAAVTGENTAAAVRGCAAWPALHQRINARVAAGDALGEVVGVLEGLDLRDARKPAAVASSRIQPVEDREAAALAEALSPQRGWDHASATVLHGQHGHGVDATLEQRGMRLSAGEDEGASRPGASELAQQAAYVATERGVITADWLARDLGVEYSSAVRLVEALERDGLVGPADGRQHAALVRRSDVDTYLGLSETESTRAWRTELAQAAEHAGQAGSVSTAELQRALDVTYPRATNLLDGLSAAGIVADEAADHRTALVSSPEQARGQLGQQPAGLSPGSSPAQDPELLARAGELVTGEQWGSTRMLQRRLQLAPDEAVTLMNALEAHQIVGPADEHGRVRTVHAQPGEVASLLGHATTPASSSPSTTSTQRPAAASQPSPQQQASGPSLG